MRSARGLLSNPNIRFSCTVNHGKMDPCCEIKMPLAFGLVRGTPSMEIEPLSGSMNPAIMFINVVLPHPDGPTMATNSPSPTVKSTPSTTCRGPFLETKLLRTSRTSILVRITPSHHLHTFQ